MKKFVKKCILFVILWIIPAFIADFAISRLVQPQANLRSWQDLYSGDIKADLVIFGSSRTHYGFNPKIIEDSLHIQAYNLGMTAGRIQIDYLRLLEYLRLNSYKPKYITLEIDYITLDDVNCISKHWQLYPYMLYNKNVFKCTFGMDGYKKWYYVCPLARYYGNFADLLKNSHQAPPKDYYKGYCPLHEHFGDIWTPENDTTKKTIKIDSKKIDLLIEFINTCKNNNIKLNFIYTPEYYFVSHKITNRDSIIDIINNIAKRNNIPFSDISHPYFCTDTTYFYDMRHVNWRGADKFTSEYYVPWIKELYGL